MTHYRITVLDKSWTFEDSRTMREIVAHFRNQVFAHGVEFNIETV